MKSENSCTRCLLNTAVPGISIHENGLCSVCTEYERLWGDWEHIKIERNEELENIINKIRKKNHLYDVLVPLSGGKDSVYALYVCRKQFNLKCLAVTWNNGFLSDHARHNIKSACDILGVDHMYFGINRDLLMRLYRMFFLKTGFFCPVCLRGMSATISRAQNAFNIPLAISGTARRTEEHVSPEFFLDDSPSFIENVLSGEPLEKEASLLLEPVGTFTSPPRIRLPDYADWNYDDIYKTIRNELGWEAHSEYAEHTDCEVDGIVNYMRYVKFPALIPEMLRFSKLVTVGQMSRCEAEKRVFGAEKHIQEPENFEWFLNTLEIKREEFDAVLSEPLRHMKYMKHRNHVLRRIRYLKKKLAL